MPFLPLKRPAWVAFALIALSSIIVMSSGVANIAAYFQQGSSAVSALNTTPNLPADARARVTWLSDDADTGRAIEPGTRREVESAYLRAWLQWNVSYERNEPYGLKTYFVGPALAAVEDSVRQAAAQNWYVEQADSAHNLTLHFYATSESTVSFTDSDALVMQIIRDDSGKVVYAGETRASYDVVMFIEDGNWRVRHWVRTDGTAFDDAAGIAAPQPLDEFVTTSGGMLRLNGQPYTVAGVNYYPQATPWDMFWPRYDPAVTEADFARIQALGMNTVRVFVQYEQFGGANVDPSMLAKLDDLLARADAHGLKAIITLFDFRTDYKPRIWGDADRHLQALLTHFANNPTILAWDLKNEPDLDYATSGRETVDAWLAHTARLARTYDPHHLLTVGWSSPAAAHALANSVDLVSFHFYAPAVELPTAYQSLQAAVPNRPIAMTEFGLPTWNSVFPNGHTEAEQAAYYADMLGFMRDLKGGYLSWTLYDFDDVSKQIGARWPWQSGPQEHLGLLRVDGTAKPAAALLKPSATLDVSPVPAWARFLKPFWLMLLGMLVSVVGFVIFTSRRWRTNIRKPN